jgi:hypothetical protein
MVAELSEGLSMCLLFVARRAFVRVSGFSKLSPAQSSPHGYVALSRFVMEDIECYNRVVGGEAIVRGG